MSGWAAITLRAGAYAAGLRQTARGLQLAATPIFAAMALLSAYDADDGMICSMQGSSMLTGMVFMYLLMSLFHLGAWLKLFIRDSNGYDA